MKLKNLKKKIRRLEARLQEGPKKLAKLKQKLEAATAASAEKARRKAATHARAALQPVKPVIPTQKKSMPSKAKAPTKPAGAKGPDPARKVKRKLNLSPARRAQLSAAMKARWAAKRAAAEANPQNASAEGDFTLGRVPLSLDPRRTTPR
jgi:DNA repair exonuclease SbcCD ATPase subunit